MIYLITGLPGHGKTLYSIKMLLDLQASNRPVYSDIDGLNIPGILESPEDWTATPNGSVVCYDEAQKRFPADGSVGRSKRPDIAQMEVHRHTGHDLIIITQNPKLINAHVRRLVGRHHHVERQMGMKHARVYTRDGAMNIESKSELKNADSATWMYPKEHFDLYKSATQHINTRRLDTKLKWGLATFGVFLLLFVGFLVNSMDFWTGTGGDVQAQDAPLNGAIAEYIAPQPENWLDHNWTSVPVKVDISGCVATKTRCQCYNNEGNPLLMDTQECMKRVNEPLPFNIKPEFKEAQTTTEPITS